MKRRQLFEFGDQKWLPDIWRGYLADILGYQAGIIYQLALPKLIEALKKTKTRQILDLCSGSGGPWPVLGKQLNQYAPYPIHITLSDKYPEAYSTTKWDKHPHIHYRSQSLDVHTSTLDLPGFRTLFSSFHHFDRPDALRFLSEASQNGNPVAIFEFTERRRERLREMWSAPILVFKLTKRLPKKSWSRVFWTYILPVIPAIYFWDGMVSHFRTYTPKELEEMCAKCDNDNYNWECGQIGHSKTSHRITYLIGLPK